MKPAELMLLFEEWKRGVASLRGDQLLQKKVEFDAAPRVADLTMLQSAALEAMLSKEFGADWHKTLEEYKKRVGDNA